MSVAGRGYSLLVGGFEELKEGVVFVSAAGKAKIYFGWKGNDLI